MAARTDDPPDVRCSHDYSSPCTPRRGYRVRPPRRSPAPHIRRNHSTELDQALSCPLWTRRSAWIDRKKNLSRITVVTNGKPIVIEQIIAQFERIVLVHKVIDLTI